MADNPFDMLLKSQRAASQLAADTLRLAKDTAVTGVTQPTQLAAQVGELATTVAGIAGSLTSVTGQIANPLRDVLAGQRELAETVATLAAAQAELAQVFATLADKHVKALSAMEALATPVLAFADKETPGK